MLPGRNSSVGSDVSWESRGNFGHENISTAILPLLLIQEEQLSVNGERMCAKYW